MLDKRRKYKIRCLYMALYDYEELVKMNIPLGVKRDLFTGKVIYEEKLEHKVGGFEVDSSIIARAVANGFEIMFLNEKEVYVLYQEVTSILGRNSVNTVREYLGDEYIDDKKQFMYHMEHFNALKLYIEEQYDRLLNIVNTEVNKRVSLSKNILFGTIKKKSTKEAECNEDDNIYF